MTNDEAAAPKVDKAEMITWPHQRRLDRISQIYIHHPQVKPIWQQIRLHWEFGMRAREATTAYVSGNSRCGKSETLKRFVKEKTGNPVPKTMEGRAAIIEGNGARIVYLDAMNGATP